MPTPRSTPAKALAALLGLAVILTPATMASAAKKAPATKACSLKKKAKCKKARLVKVKVGKVNLSGATLAGATITGATFSGTNLTNVDMTGAKISNTTFTNVKVGNLKMDNATLTNVTFTGVTTGSARQAAREQDCTASEGIAADTTSDVFTCTGGGISLRGAVLSRHVEFRNSVIPFSDFAGVTTGEAAKKSSAFGSALLLFTGTDAHASNFTGAKAVTATYDAQGTGTRSNVSRSVFNMAWLWGLTDTDANEASFMGTVWVFHGPASFGDKNVTATGARGLQGARAVTLTTQVGLPSVGATNIREDGYWKAGVLCQNAGVARCVNSEVAVGQPVVVKAWATTPIQIAGPTSWTCDRLSGTATYPYLAQCTVPAADVGDQTAEVQRYAPPVMRMMSVTMRDGLTMLPNPLLSATISQLNADRSVAVTKTCTGTATCSLSVVDGSTVAMSFQAPQQLVGWCSDAATMFTGTAPPTSSYVCPDIVATTDVHATVQTS